jgi:uncharacterized membrane-anchored protein YitT (DUF2179 family)
MIETTIYNILGVAVVGVMIAFWYTPIQRVKGRFVTLFRGSPFLHRNVDIILNCPKCCTFLLALLLFQHFLTAALTSFIAFVIGHIIDRIERWYE